MTAETFKHEVTKAIQVYEKYVVCLDKTPEQFEESLTSLLQKAIKAYANRGPQLRHGIALDGHVTVILSQTENATPLCGIYFNLYSPYQKQSLPKVVKPLPEKIGGGRSNSEQ